MQGKFNRSAWEAAKTQDTSDQVVGQLASGAKKLIENPGATEAQIRSMIQSCEVVAHAFVMQAIQFQEQQQTGHLVSRASAKAGERSAKDLEAAFDSLSDQLRARLP